MNERSDTSKGLMLSAFLMFCIIAAAIFVGWHIVLRYASTTPYKAPQKPYVSVTKSLNRHHFGNLEKSFERQIMDFWRFGAE